jgi:acyl carrier protein
MNPKILATLAQILKEEWGESGAIDPTSRFEDDFNFDELDLTTFVCSIEETFEIDISDDEQDALDTIRQTVDLIISKLIAAERLEDWL